MTTWTQASWTFSPLEINHTVLQRDFGLMLTGTLQTALEYGKAG